MASEKRIEAATVTDKIIDPGSEIYVAVKLLDRIEAQHEHVQALIAEASGVLDTAAVNSAFVRRAITTLDWGDLEARIIATIDDFGYETVTDPGMLVDTVRAWLDGDET